MACFLPVLASGYCDFRDRTSCHQQRLANSRLDCRARHNGRGVYCERAPLWARALLPHRPLLPPDGLHRVVVRSRHPASRGERLEPARYSGPGRRPRPVVPARDVFGNISAPKLTANRFMTGYLERLRNDEIGASVTVGLARGRSEGDESPELRIVSE